MSEKILGSILYLLIHFPILIVWAVVGGVAWLGLTYLRVRLGRWWDVTRRGWTVDPSAARDRLEYREVVNGRLEKLRFRTEWHQGEVVVFLPRKLAWDGATPEWAHGRWEEIVARIRPRVLASYVEFRFE